MPREDAEARLLQFAVRRIVFAVEGPIGMRVQLFEAFIEAIDRREEGFGIGGVNRDRHVVSGTGFPHWIEALVVHLDQRPAVEFFTYHEAERLEYLESTRTCLMCPHDLVALKFCVSWLGHARKPGLGENDEPARMCLCELLHAFF